MKKKLAIDVALGLDRARRDKWAFQAFKKKMKKKLVRIPKV